LEETARLIDRIGRSGAVARSYTDFGQVVAALVESFAGISQLSGNHVQLAPSTAPSALDLPWHLLTETYEAEDGIFSDMILLRKEGAR
ncbi:MAG TPA: hypothetical protein VJ952_06065, partial [Opitutales bacterium]|nr:hypothetical protein [Opitutales bacterium]